MFTEVSKHLRLALKTKHFQFTRNFYIKVLNYILL